MSEDQQVQEQVEQCLEIHAKQIPEHGHERREKVVFLNESLLIDVLNWCNAPAGTQLFLPTNCDFPEGTRVERVWSEYSRRCVAALVSHPSFDCVPDGCDAPLHPSCGSYAVRSITRANQLPAPDDGADIETQRQYWQTMFSRNMAEYQMINEKLAALKQKEETERELT